MAKAESGLRTRIKKALEADGWSVVVQHGSAYSPYIPDLLVVLAALEVKTETGILEPGQRNRIRRFRREGIPAGVVRSIEDARQGMNRIKQGVYRVAVDQEIDMSFLNSFLNGSDVSDAAPEAAPEPTPSLGSSPALDELLGMQGTFQEFDTTPAPDPDGEAPESAPEQAPARTLVDTWNSVQKPAETAPAAPETFPSYTLTQTGGMGVLERLEARLEHIEAMFASLLSGVQGGVVPQPVAASEAPVRRTRRTRAQIEADNAAAAAVE